MKKLLATLKANVKDIESKMDNATTYEEAMSYFGEWKEARRKYTDLIILLEQDNPHYDCE